MSKIAVRELIRSGVELFRKHRGDASTPPGTPIDIVEIESVLDRLAQLGTILIDSNEAVLWEDLVSGFAEIFTMSRPQQTGLNAVREDEAQLVLLVTERLMLLGAVIRRRSRYQFVRPLVLQIPDTQFGTYYWLRYAVTMIARGNLESWKKSLIGPSSELTRTRPEFFALFDENMDTVVNAMCQFDFLQCVVTVAETRDVSRCYPSFGAYWNNRTTPMVRELIDGGPARLAIGDVSNDDLADILDALDKMTANNFFSFAGWDRNDWGDAHINDFVHKHAGKSTVDDT